MNEPTSAPTVEQIRSRNRYLNDAVIDACKRALNTKSKDLWMTWFRLAGEKVGLEEYLATVPAKDRGYNIGPGSGCTNGPQGEIYQSDWRTAVYVVSEAAMTECSTIQEADILHELGKGREHSSAWAQGLRSLLE